jgi:tRNA dimethylallyltransferase
LYKKINARVQKMFDDGLVDEVKSILAKWFTLHDVAMKTIWYKEVGEYWEWKISLQECIAQVQQGNRNYAKRQLTWFRRYEE